MLVEVVLGTVIGYCISFFQNKMFDHILYSHFAPVISSQGKDAELRKTLSQVE